MIEKAKWTERNFKTDDRTTLFPNIVERLRGTPARLEDKLNGLSVNRLCEQINNKWSIQEHAGHLLDLEDLWTGRLDDFLKQREMLRPADMTNQKTDQANHNENKLKHILQEFRNQRLKLCSQLDQLSFEDISIQAMHPRLKQKMTIVDLIAFVAEHDDHHLSSIQTLIVQTEKK